MIVDVNAYVGHWPFRQLRHNNANGLLRLMDSNEIDKAMVSSINAIFYRNCHSGNEELYQSAKNHRDRLITFATLNPKYAGWKDDLKQCREEYHMSGIRILPQYHDYKLSDNEAIEMINLATEMKMIISIPIRMEDRRQRHWLDKVSDLQLSEIESAMKSCRKARFIILNGRGFENMAKNGDLTESNFLIEISRLGVVLQGEIPRLIEILGSSKLAFGTGIPFNYPMPSLLKMQMLDSDGLRDELFNKNALRILNFD